MHKANALWNRCSVGILTLLVLPLLITARHSTNEGAPAPPGKLVEIGGRRLHINCEGKGEPTVVMEAGAGDFSFDWGLVQPQVARFARVCSYDRAGYAWSDPGPTPRTMRQIAFELHTGLLKAGIKGPYILVGHSLGGAIVRTYVSQYPKEVAGMVLVDSVHEEGLIGITDRTTKQDKIVRWRELSRGRQIPPIQTAAPNPTSSSNPQQARASSSAQTKVEAPFDKLPERSQRMRLWAKSQPNYNPARSSELFDFFPEELDSLYSEREKSKNPLGAMPLIVMTSTVSEYGSADEQTKKRLSEDRKRLQSDLLMLSSNSKQIVTEKSGHHIQLDEPGLVIDAIQQVVKASRTGSKLIRDP
jgi:pimeloyl-ACP methyl ester carboxylesterase